jgi:FKBP-type peptidyl-prolyl cis-trans isomerase SlpA
MSSVQAGSFLTLHYRLAGPHGDIINTFGEKPATLSIGSGELSPGVEAHLMGLEEGTRRSFEIAPGEAFGPRNPDMVQWLSRKLLSDIGDPSAHYVLGDVVQFPAPQGQGQYAGVVLQVNADGAVQIDFNHPLAGQAVTFEVQIIGVL